MQWASSALLCLQEIAEDDLVGFFSDGYILISHAHRVTIMPRDFDTLQRLRFRFDQLLQPIPLRDMRTMNILNITPLHPCAQQTEPTRANLNKRSTRSRVKRNSKDGQADEGHEQVRVIEEIEIVLEEPIMQENEQNMEDAEHVPVSDPMSLSESVPISEPTPLSEPISEAPMLVREDAMPVMEDPVQERQGKGSASQRPSNMEPLSDEAIILVEINKENKEELQVLIKSAPLHAKIMLPRRS
ncbi:hypothetical protein L7F22_054953 [Adiantum nelumboides]|nr:hypothetical protein [Adiantum nelumboides]